MEKAEKVVGQPDSSTSTALQQIDLDMLDVAKELVRDTGIDELADSIDQYGQVVPAIVRALPEGRFFLEDGTRRLAALRKLAEKGKRLRLLAFVRTGDPGSDRADAVTLQALVANVMRAEFTKLDKARYARAIIAVAKDYGGRRTTQKQAASILSVKESTLSSWLTVYGDEGMRSLIAEHGLAFSACRAICSITDGKQRELFVGRLLKEKERDGRFPAVRVLEKAARHPGLRAAILDDALDFGAATVLVGARGIDSDEVLDVVIGEIRRRQDESGRKLSPDELAALIPGAQEPAGRELGHEKARQVLAGLASASEPPAVEIRAVSDGGPLRIIVLGGKDTLAALVQGLSGQ